MQNASLTKALLSTISHQPRSISHRHTWPNRVLAVLHFSSDNGLKRHERKKVQTHAGSGLDGKKTRRAHPELSEAAGLTHAEMRPRTQRAAVKFGKSGSRDAQEVREGRGNDRRVRGRQHGHQHVRPAEREAERRRRVCRRRQT
eukprot:6212313-Pleurochrysis_carterae.AAC.7